MKRRALIFLVACLVTAGCKSNSDESSTESAKSAEPADEPADEQAEPAKPESSKPEMDLEWRPSFPDDLEPMSVTYVPTEGFPVRGAPADESLVTIVAVGDYGCPDTENRSNLPEEALEQHGDEVRFVYRNVVWVPGEYGPFAANLAAAARQRGEYWNAYDIIWKRFRKLEEYGRKSYVEALGLTLKDLEKAKKEAKSVADQNQDFAQKHNVQWVPTFFVNGVPVAKASDEDFHKFVDVQIEKARRVQETSGLSGDELYKRLVEANKGEK